MRMLFAAVVLAVVISGPVAAQTARGEQLFKQRCQACHQVKAGGSSALGPNLAGVVGRKAGATAFRHSPAFARTRLVWTRDNLDRFIKAPTRFIPGTRMVMGIADPAQRKAIVDYLATRK